MFNAIKIHNVEEFWKYNDKTRIIFRANGEEGVIGAELEINTVGPCIARLFVEPEGEQEEITEYLLGVFEGNKTIQFAIKANSAAVRLEPSAEVWYRKADRFTVADNPNPEENFTRMEKMGLEMDELSIALHRSDVLHRIANDRDNLVRDQYSRKLERDLAELGKRIEALTPKAEAEAEKPVTEVKPVAEAAK